MVYRITLFSSPGVHGFSPVLLKTVRVLVCDSFALCRKRQAIIIFWVTLTSAWLISIYRQRELGGECPAEPPYRISIITRLT